MNNIRVLIVSSDLPHLRKLRGAMIGHGFEVFEVQTPLEAAEQARTGRADLVMVEVDRSPKTGANACRLIRSDSAVPVIIVSAEESEQAKVEALEAGADDYMTIPLGTEEMAARIRAVLRRSAGASRHLFALGAVEVDLDRHEVRRDGATIHLTAKEFKLLRQLIACAGEVVTHRRLLQAVWGAEYGDEVEYLRVFINQLRKKLEPNPTKPKYLITEPAIGYRLTVP